MSTASEYVAALIGYSLPFAVIGYLAPAFFRWSAPLAILAGPIGGSALPKACRNVKRWRNAKMGLRWTASGMLEAKKGFRRLKAHKHLPVLKAALQNHRAVQTNTPAVDSLADAA